MLSDYLTPTNQKRLKLLKKSLMSDPSFKLIIQSDSMVPTLSPGTPITFENRDPRPGDIIGIFLASGDLLVHRFLGKINQNNLTKGDNSRCFELSALTMFIGKVHYQPSFIEIIRARFQFTFFQLKKLLSKVYFKPQKKLLKYRLIHSYSYENNFFLCVTFFNIYNFDTLSIAARLKQSWGENVRCLPIDIESYSCAKAFQILNEISKSPHPWEEETVVKAYFCACKIAPCDNRILEAFCEVILTKIGKTKNSTLNEILEIIKKTAGGALRNEINSKIV